MDADEKQILRNSLRREREHRRVACLEQYSTFAHVFQCVVCRVVRKFEDSRDGWSFVCVHCARRAGLPE